MGIIINGDVKGDVIGEGGVKNETHYHHGNEPQTQSRNGQQVAHGLSHDLLARAVQAVQSHMWGASAYAVLFCECRDHWGFLNNMAQFERDINVIAEEYNLAYRCNEGTLSDAFRHNPYLEKHVDKWKENGVRTRSMHLLQKFQEALP